ncbi:MAG: hypothetical protein Q9195_009054 [Heterodermia aff. obscurata]
MADPHRIFTQAEYLVYGRLMVDDGLVIFAFTCLLIGSIIFSVFIHTTYVVQDVNVQHAKPPSHFKEMLDQYKRYQWAGAYLFFTSIWSIKGSFLAFYDDLTRRLPRYRRAWWAAIVITVLTYIGSLLAYAFLDGIQLTTTSRNQAIKYQFAADLVTDLIITAIPLTLALKSQVPTKQKIGLAGVFSLTLIITIMSIVRFSLNGPGSGVAIASWLQAWSVIEQGISVIISCFASFRIYLMNKTKTRKASSSKDRYMNSFIARKVGDGSSKSGSSHARSHGTKASASKEVRDSMDIELLDMAHAKSAGENNSNNSKTGDPNLGIEPFNAEERTNIA